MEDIKVGEYVRINKGIIGKVIDIFEGHAFAKYHIEFQTGVKVKKQWLSTRTIISHSFNITDLIEVRRLCKWNFSYWQRKYFIVY